MNKNKIIAVSITFITIIILAGITYTFFSASVSNTNNEKLLTQTATMSLKFDDNDNGVSGTLNLGESIVKKFTLENTGTVDSYGKINWYNLVNTYTQSSLTWTLEQSETENGTYTRVARGIVPTSNSETTKILTDSLLVPEGKKYYYRLTITLNNLDYNQNSDINATMNSKFSLEAGEKTAVETLQNLVADNPTNSVKEIDLSAYEAYVFDFNGFIWPQDWEYYETDMEGCQEDLDELLEVYGPTVTGECQINPGTGKYNMNLHGLVTNPASSSYIYETQEDCEDNIESLSIENTSCTLSSVSGKYINPYSCTNTLAYDGTSDNNLRFVGSNPCNAIKIRDSSFDNANHGKYHGLIIGVMNNVDDGTGKKETRLKVVITGTESYYNVSLKYGLTNKYSSPLTNAQTLNAKWHIKGIPSNTTYIMPNTIYDIEKTNGSVYEGNSATWTGSYGTLSISDYAQAVGSGIREACLSKNLISTDGSSSDYVQKGCRRNNYMSENRNSNIWTMNAVSDNNSQAFVISPQTLLIQNVQSINKILYTIYLPANTSFIRGTGDVDDPYVVELNEIIDENVIQHPN